MIISWKASNILYIIIILFLNISQSFRKKRTRPDPSPWGRSWAQDGCSRAARSAVFKRKSKMANEACLRWRRSLNNSMECFHMTSRRPCWCPKTMKRRPCWCPKPILWELNSFLMQTISFVPINLHRCWPREWKHSIGSY